MTVTEALLKAIDDAQWELSEALKFVPDGDVWKRPDPRLLSIGELAAHIAWGEAQCFFGDAFETSLNSPLSHYYSMNVQEPYALPLSALQIASEVERVHKACKEEFLKMSPDLESINVFREGWTWHYTLEYQAFHISYHAGQIYTVRHLLGHETPDN